MTRRAAAALIAGSAAIAAAPPSGAVRAAPIPTPTCSAPTRAEGLAAVASLQLERPLGARDTVVSLLVCVRATDPATRIGGFHGEARYDTLDARLLGVDHLANAAQVENVAQRGRVQFAGAAPTGTAPGGALLRVRLRALRRGRLPWADLVMLEVNSVDGAPLVARTRVESLRGAPEHPIAGEVDDDAGAEGGDAQRAAERATERTELRDEARVRPVVTSVSPRSARLRDDGAPIVVVVRGRGFTPATNTVLFGATVVANVRSTDGGTRLRFTVPDGVVSAGGAPPRPLGPGRYAVRVRTSGGTSVGVAFTLRP